MIELLRTKLFIPRPRKNLIFRPRLVDQLNAGLEKKLTLVSAPAGFGKTTLVVAWLNQLDCPAAWLSLDEADNDLPRFLTYLAAALQQVDEGTGASLLNALQSPQLPPVEKILTALLNETAIRIEPLILVLDDAHLLSDGAVLAALGFLLDHLPPQLHLVLTTREDPDLPLARLRVRDQLIEIRASDLRFTLEETGAFLRGVMGLELSGGEVAVLEERTEGWAAGLQLAGLSMQKQADITSFIADFSGSHRHILDYLTEEVLQRQPEGIRTFLLQTSILERMSAPLCDAILGDKGGVDRGIEAENSFPYPLPLTPSPPPPSNSQSILDTLEKSNLFVIPLDGERRWYRYHHLFSDLLRSQLARSQPELVPELHRRASRWYEQNGEIQAAVDHALQDTDLTQAAALVERYAFPKMYQGHIALVVGWFDRLPEEVLEAAPMLCIHKAWALVMTRRSSRAGEVERALLAADLALGRVNAGGALRNRVAGHAACIQAFLLRIRAQSGKQLGRLVDLAQEAQRLLPEDEIAQRGGAALNLGYGYLALADLESASLAFKQALEVGLSGGNFFAAIYGPINLILIAIQGGRLEEALQLCEINIERFNHLLAGQSFPPIGALYILKGSILLEHDRLAEVEPVLTEGLDLVSWTGETMASRRGYTALARLRIIQRDLPAMGEAVKALEETWPEGALYCQALRHRLSMRHSPGNPGVRKDALAWLAQSGIEFGDLAVIDSIDPVSVISFETYLYAAHVLARLAMDKPVAKGTPGIFPLQGAHAYLERQQDFTASHGFVRWTVEIAVARTLLYQAAGKKQEALDCLAEALRAAAPTSLFRIFVDECEPLQALLEELTPRLSDPGLISYANRLLDAMSCRPAKPAAAEGYPERLSERELEVLQRLAEGLTYEAIGRQLFLSLNTVQFHVKNIYGKLLVNKRAHAIEKAREMKLI